MIEVDEPNYIVEAQKHIDKICAYMEKVGYSPLEAIGLLQLTISSLQDELLDAGTLESDEEQPEITEEVTKSEPDHTENVGN